MISFSRPLKCVAGFMELFLGFPIVGGAFVITLGWIPLMVMLFIHFLGYYLARDERRTTWGHCTGILTSIFAVIPFIGMILHLVTAFLLLQEAYENA